MSHEEGRERIAKCPALNSLLFRPQLKAHNSMLKVIENNCKSNFAFEFQRAGRREGSEKSIFRLLLRRLRRARRRRRSWSQNKCCILTLPLPSSINKKEIQVSRESSADRKSAGTIAVSVVFFFRVREKR
jgi:hypothetical protein